MANNPLKRKPTLNPTERIYGAIPLSKNQTHIIEQNTQPKYHAARYGLNEPNGTKADLSAQTKENGANETSPKYEAKFEENAFNVLNERMRKRIAQRRTLNTVTN